MHAGRRKNNGCGGIVVPPGIAASFDRSGKKFEELFILSRTTESE
jgi:hypothetical protein